MASHPKSAVQRAVSGWLTLALSGMTQMPKVLGVVGSMLIWAAKILLANYLISLSPFFVFKMEASSLRNALNLVTEKLPI